MAIKTLAANMRNAFVERKSAKIGGGIFTPEELKDGAIALNAFPDLLAALLDCIAVMERDLNGLPVIQPELRQARAAIAKAGG
jgi:hypothetical protein